MMDNHQDPHNSLQQLPRWPITILYSNMQSCWRPIKRQLSTHIPRHIPDGFISSGLLPQYSCHEKRLMQDNLSHACWQTHWAVFGRTGIARLLRHSARLPEYWLVSHHECQVPWSVEDQVDGCNIKYFLGEPHERHRRVVHYLQFHADSHKPRETANVLEH